jgi:hypothetical protein
VRKGVEEMSILIKGMEMPSEGEYHMTLYVCSDGSAYIDVASFPVDEDRFKAVSVPPHYDLIDHNALKIAVMDCDAETRIDFLKHAMDCINKAPVVIPSDMPTYEAEEGE